MGYFQSLFNFFDAFNWLLLLVLNWIRDVIDLTLQMFDHWFYLVTLMKYYVVFILVESLQCSTVILSCRHLCLHLLLLLFQSLLHIDRNSFLFRYVDLLWNLILFVTILAFELLQTSLQLINLLLILLLLFLGLNQHCFYYMQLLSLLLLHLLLR